MKRLQALWLGVCLILLSGLVTAQPVLAQTDPAVRRISDESADSTGKKEQPPAEEMNQLQEIVVTAQKREQNLQNVPIAITAVTQQEIESRSLEGFRDWQAYVPGISIAQGEDSSDRTGPEVTIRGISQVVRGQLYELPALSTTTFTIGQVPFSNGDPGMYDLARVEVLAGPQGTLQGIAAMGGTVRFIPNEAQTQNYAAEVDADGGSMDQGANTSSFGFMMNVPLIQNVLAIRIAARHEYNGGWIDVIKPSLSETAPIQINQADFTQSINPSNTLTNANVMDKTGARISLTYTPNDNFVLKAFTNWQKLSYANTNEADVNAVSSKPELIVFATQPQLEDFTVSSVEASEDLGFGSLQFVGGWYTGRNNSTTDSTPQDVTLLQGKIPVLQANPLLPADPFPVASQFPFNTQSQIRDGELRLQGQEKPLGFGGMTFDYIGGLYYETEARDGEWVISAPNWNVDKGPNTLPILTEGGVIDASMGGGFLQNKAFYTNLTLHVTKKLSFAAGIRFFEEKFHSGEFRYGDFYSGKASNGATVGDNFAAPRTPAEHQNFGHIEESGNTPSATVSYKFDNDRMAYFTAAQGKRLPAGFPNPTALSTIPAECTPLAASLGLLNSLNNGTTTDSVWSYELGLKSKWLDDRLLVNADVYYLDWTNLQESVSLVQYDPICNAQIPTNAGEAISKGIELQSVYALNEHWHLQMTLGTTDAYFSKVPVAIGSSLPGVDLKPGDRLRMTPPMTASAGAEFGFGLPPILDGNRFSGFWRIDWRYVGGRMDNFGDPRLLEASPSRSKYFANAYNLTDMRIGVKRDDLTITFYASNLFNQLAMYESDQNALEPNFREASINMPRTIGISVRKEFF